MMYYVYMMTNRSRVVLYTGITNRLESRLCFHANGPARSFTKRYKIDRLVYYVEALNPKWNDLRIEMFAESIPASASLATAKANR